MRTAPRVPRQAVISFRVTAEVRALLDKLAVSLTAKWGQRCTLTDAIEEGLRLLARREGVKAQ